jgi:hypothetical protein
MAERWKFIKQLFPRKRVSPTKTYGVPGVSVVGGFVQTEEVNADLVGQNKWIQFSEALVNVGIVGAGIRYFLNLIARATWNATPPEDSGEAGIEAAKFMNDVLHDMDTPFARICRRASMYKFHGFSIQEWTAKKRDDGKIGMKDIEPRSQPTIERWDQDKHGNVFGVVQRSRTDGQEIYLPRKKIVYLVDDSISDSPEGLGILRHIVPHAKRLQQYENIEGIGMETDLRGIPIGRVPLAVLAQAVKDQRITQEEADQAKAVMEDFITNHVRSLDTGLVVDSLTYQTQDEKGAPSNVPQWAVELLQNNTTALPDAAAAINRLTHTIARLIGVEHLLLGTEKGSFALSRDKSHNFFMVVDSALNEIGSAMEKDVVDPIWALNGFDDKLKPKLVPETSRFRDIEQITGALKDLAAAGLTIDPADPIVGFLRDLIGAPRLEGTQLMKPVEEKPKEEDDAGRDSSPDE